RVDCHDLACGGGLRLALSRACPQTAFSQRGRVADDLPGRSSGSADEVRHCTCGRTGGLRRTPGPRMLEIALAFVADDSAHDARAHRRGGEFARISDGRVQTGHVELVGGGASRAGMAGPQEYPYGECMFAATAPGGLVNSIYRMALGEQF